MKKYLLLITILFSTFLFAETNQVVNTTSAKQTSFVDVKKKSEIKRALVCELLQLVNAKQQSQEVLNSMIKMMPSDICDSFKKALNADEMMELVIPVYEKYLTIDDLKSMIKFYKSPAGKKLLEAQPKIMKDSMIVMKVYVQKKLSTMK